MNDQDLTSKMIKCGQILTHKTGKKRGQENILEILSIHNELSQTELRKMLNIEAGSLSEILAKLEKRHMIKRYHDIHDKRRLVVSITEQGMDKIKNRKTNDEDIFDMLTLEQKEYLNQTLDYILEEWQKRHFRYHQNDEK